MYPNNEWLQKSLEKYWADRNDMYESIEEPDDLDKLGQGFTSADPLEEVDIGDGSVPRPTYINKVWKPITKLH
jgi:hypothetical protein